MITLEPMFLAIIERLQGHVTLPPWGKGGGVRQMRTSFGDPMQGVGGDAPQRRNGVGSIRVR